MTLVRWQPKSMVRSNARTPIDTEFDRLFDWAFGTDRGVARPMVPAMDVVEEESRYLLRADLPGMTKEDLQITFQDGVLAIEGERKQETKSENSRTYCRERFEGRFARNLRLPDNVEVEQIQATMKDGVLELVLPFTPEAQPKKIEVKG